MLSLTHWYTFNDGTGLDQAGTRDAGIINGATVVNGQVVLANSGVTSGQSSTVQFINLPSDAVPSAGAMTVEVWFTASSAENWTRVFDVGDKSGSDGNSYLFYTPQSSYRDSRLVFTPGGIDNEIVVNTATTDNGSERMIAGVVDVNSDTLRLYVDGTQVGSLPLNGLDMSAMNTTFAYVGRSLYDTDPGFTGSINEVRIYNEALTGSAIGAHAAAGPTPVEPPDPPDPLPARRAEALNRGVIALRRATSQVYVGWRMLGTDPDSVAFNLYRSTNGGAPVKLNATPLAQTTDYVDTTANMSATNVYFVRPLIAGIELAPSESFTLPANVPVRQYLNIPLNIPPNGTTPAREDYTYNANDASVGDLDGDGQYEIILKWDPSNSKDNSQSGYTGNTYIDAYQLDGSFLWRIDLGRNVRSGAHYSPFIVYDLDGDGKAEIVMRTAEATVDGVGTVIGNPNADYRNSSGYVLSGPEYLTVFNGETGAIVSSIPFMPQRGSVSSWGDIYGNRVDRFQATVAYLQPDHPSIVWNRGYAGPQSGFNARNEVAAFDYADGQLSLRWLFEAATNGQNPGYVGQSAHSITVGDVDFDGRDEIITGAAALDDDGTLLYNTGLGHGDAMHLSDMDPTRPGLEFFMPHESPTSYGDAGGEYRDAATGELLLGIPSTNDVGRGVALDIDPNYPGYEMWATTNVGTRMIYNAQGQPIYPTPGNMMYNFGVYWDADLQSELLDGTTISEWNNPGRSNVVSFGSGGINSTAGLSGNNGSKNTPSLVADILGDWREEVIWRRSDNSALQIWSTTIPATTRLYTLMHDIQYREAISWQNSGYNQPPHPSFLLAGTIPLSNVYTVSANPTIPGDFDLDGDVDFDDRDIWQQTYGMAQDHGYLPGDGDADGDVDGSDYLIWQRNLGKSQTTPLVTANSQVIATSLRDVAMESLMNLTLTKFTTRPSQQSTILDPGEEGTEQVKTGVSNDFVAPSAFRSRREESRPARRTRFSDPPTLSPSVVDAAFSGEGGIEYVMKRLSWDPILVR